MAELHPRRPEPVRVEESDSGFVVVGQSRLEVVETPATADRQIELLGERTVAVRLANTGSGRTTERFVAENQERWLGFGERSHAVSLERGEIEHYVGEGPYQPHEYPLLVGSVPPWGVRERPDATYYPIPWALSTRGYGVLLDNDEFSRFRFRTDAPDRWEAEVDANSLSYRIFFGDSPLDALQLFTDATGRQPEPEPWFFGPWFQTGHQNHVPLEAEQLQLARQTEAGALVVAAETHCRYLPVGENRGYEAEERARTAFFHDQGLKVLSYLNPLVSVDYPEAFEPANRKRALQKNADGSTYLFQAYAGGRAPPHTMETQYDFTTEAGLECWLEVARKLVDAGYDGWMEDFGEYTPLDAFQADGSTGTAAHNRYPRDFHGAAAAATTRLEHETGKRFARFARSGWTGNAPHVPIVWGGDPTSSWGFDGLASAVIEALSAGASGVAMWASDIGGFFSTIDQLSPELLRRWIQFGAFSPVMRTKSAGIEVPHYDRPQIWDDDVLPTWVRYTRIHVGLLGYLEESHSLYRRTGRPIMAALELLYPEEPLVAGVDDEYLFGPDLLVAPVLAPGVEVRSVVFPPGEWQDALERHSDVISGPLRRDIEVCDDIPVFRRAGASVVLDLG